MKFLCIVNNVRQRTGPADSFEKHTDYGVAIKSHRLREQRLNHRDVCSKAHVARISSTLQVSSTAGSPHGPRSSQPYSRELHAPACKVPGFGSLAAHGVSGCISTPLPARVKIGWYGNVMSLICTLTLSVLVLALVVLCSGHQKLQ